MAQITSAVNLSAAMIPFIATYKGQSILVANRSDQTAGPNRDFGGDTLEAAVNIPQLYWGENIVPTQEGYASVGYIQALPEIPSTGNVSHTFTVYDGNGSKAIIAVLDNKEVWGVSGETKAWTEINLPTPELETAFTGELTTGTAYGIVYLYFKGAGVYSLDIATLAITPVTLLGLDLSVVDGITDSQSYLIAWGKNIVAWSSALDPLDFVPSETTGAGAGTPEGIKGQIIYCKPISKGFIIYTSAMIMVGEYSGNARFPWIFRALNHGAGIADFRHVSQDTALAAHYAWTSAGMLEVSNLSCTPRFPQLTDFLASRFWEEYNPVTKDVDRMTLAEQIRCRVALIAARFFVVSYGLPDQQYYDYALIYDTALQRWGRFKHRHIQCLEITADMEFDPIDYLETEPNPYDFYERSYSSMVNWNNTPAKAKLTIGFIGVKGDVNVANMAPNNSGSEGVAVFGRYQITRGHMCSMLSVGIQGVFPGESNFAISLVTSIDGVDKINGLQGFKPLVAGDVMRTYGSRSVGKNHSIVLEGTFHVVSLELAMAQHGRR